MAKGFKHGSGSIDVMNFQVVGNPQPVNPGENTIWVNTDTPISNWIFRATQPDASSEPDLVQPGTVWFCLGTSSPVAFNALKTNEVTLCPILAKQYVDGIWKEVSARSYQQGNWAEWLVTIFYNNTFGAQYRTSTNYADFYCHSSLGVGNGVAEVVNNELVFGDNSPNYGCGGFIFTGVNLSGSKTLEIMRTRQTSAYATAHQSDICVFAVFLNGNVVFTENFRSFDVPETVNIDVSSYGDNCTLILVSYSGGHSGNTIITHVSQIIAK